MGSVVATLRQAWGTYDASERKNIGIFILGLMFYKFGLEIFIGSIIPLASDRFDESFFDCEETQNGPVVTGHLFTFRKVGVLTGVNQAAQCLGSILVAPLLQRYQTRQVLVGATVVFALLTSILLICDAATGGRPRIWGGYDPVAIFPVYCISGIAYGMIELIRRVLPRELVGGDVSIKLKRLDSAVHVFYEIAGTVGPITAVKLIDSVGENLSFFLSPASLALAGLVWFFIRPAKSHHPVALPSDLTTTDELTLTSTNGHHQVDGLETGQHGQTVENEIPFTPVKQPGYLKRLLRHTAFWGQSTFNGAIIVLGGLRFIWLVPCYSFALLAHRYLENNIANIYTKGVIQKASYQPLLVVGSNLGELLGATTVFFTADIVTSPIPFVRLSALLLLLAWFIPFFPVSGRTLNDALSMAAVFMPMSYAWAAGDVSLNAYIQANFTNLEPTRPGVSTLASIMSFLYVTYIASYTLLSSLLGLFVDTVLGKDGPCSPNFRSGARTALIGVAGIFFTVISVTMLVSTFFPRGAIALNPMLWDFQRQQTAEEVHDNHLAGPVEVRVVNRSRSPTPPHRPDSIDSAGSEQRPQPQGLLPSPTYSRPLPSPTYSGPLPSPTYSRPLPSPPFSISESHDAKHQSFMFPPTHSAPLPPPPFSAQGSHDP